MMFVDSARIHVMAGDGGKGCRSFFRDTRVEHGKPNGGEGGSGGSVVLRADKSIYTLLDFQYRRHFKAASGGHGSSNHKAGADGGDLIITVPVGTIVGDAASGCLIRDLSEHGAHVVVARGGRGGRGNSRNRDAEPGERGEERELELNLKLIADVGIVGFPNAGKSTLISKISNATPKIASYPFTTKSPALGVIHLGEDETPCVVADIPGLIEGAHEGRGLGDRFLKHVERTRVLIHLIDMAGVDGRDPLEDYLVINRELEAFSEDLAEKKQILVANKMDLPEAIVHLERFKKRFRRKIFKISAFRSDGLKGLLEEIEKNFAENRR